LEEAHWLDDCFGCKEKVSTDLRSSGSIAPHFLIDLSRKIEQYERQKPRSSVPVGMNRRIFEQNSKST
jgi:hypothetical protein